MVINKSTTDLIKSFESLRLKAYVDPGTGGEPITIGWGTTVYPNGNKVKLGDTCTKEEAQTYFNYDVQKVAANITPMIKRFLTDNQFGALVSFAYNVGENGLKDSTLLKKVNAYPNDPEIKVQFGRWNKSGGKVLNGLVRRRAAEAALYFKQF